MDKKIKIICNDCARKINSPYNKGAIGFRLGICDVCGTEKFIADAYRDYGIDEDGNIISAEQFSLSNSI